MKIMKLCEECNKPGGTVPKHYWDGVVAMLHEECAEMQMFKYMAKKERERQAELEKV